MKKSELMKHLSGKLSYQGDSLKRRIANQMKLVERDKIRERQAKQAWFEAQLRLMRAEDELTLLCTLSLKEKKGKA